MSETAKTENTEHGTQVVAPELPKAPEVNADGIKIYPTSFLPAKSQMEPSRIPTAKLTGFEIEVLHVIIFFLLTFFLFISMWKKPNVR